MSTLKLAGLAKLQILKSLHAGDSLRARAMRGSAALFAGELYSNLLRLGGNLILTRLLFPEAFGLMLIVNLVMTILAQLSDVGIKQAMIAKPGEFEDRYIDTAWTMMVVRGGILSALMALLAYPIALAYGEPLLFGLLLIASLAPLISSLGSPYPIVFEKRVKPARAILMGAGVSTIALVITVLWLLVSPTVWALAANGVIASVIGVYASYKMFPGRFPRLAWDRAIAGQIFRFGRWIVLGTALTYLARQGDRLIVSGAVSTDMLGMFSIAITLAGILEMVVGKLNFTILLPVYAEMKQKGYEYVADKQKRIKLVIYALCLPIVLVLAILGRDIISLLYDPRYAEAGWMLELLAAGSLFFVAGSVLHTMPLAFGDSFRHMWRQAFALVTTLLSMLTGNALFGFPGLIAGIGVAHIFDYVIIRIAVYKFGVRDSTLDILFMLLGSSVIGLCWWIRGWPWLLAA